MALSLLQEIRAQGDLFLAEGDNVARQKIISAANSLINELETPGERLARIGWGEPSRTAALRTAFDLGLLERLTDEPMSSSRLAEGTSADPYMIARIMKHLAANRIVREIARDEYVSTTFSRSIKEPTIRSGLIYSFEGMIPTFHGLPTFLAKTGYQTPSDPDYGPVQHGLGIQQSFFTHLRSNQHLGNAFNSFMAGYAKVRPRWFDIYPVEERLLPQSPGSEGSEAVGTDPREILLVDVGGGLGQELGSLHAAYPQLTGRLILEDLPHVIDQAVAAGTLPPIVEAAAHDFFTPQPERYRGARAYLISLVLHDWDDNKCAVILSHLRDAMVASGRPSRILISEVVMKDTGAPWQQTSLDWTMMAMVVGRERTEAQWRELLCRVRLNVGGIWSKGSQSVIEAVLV